MRFSIDFRQVLNDLNHSELLCLQRMVDKELRLSDIAIKEGFEAEE